MIKAIVVTCPNDFRKEFCQNFFKLLKNHQISFIVASLETTEKDERLKEGEDYYFVDRKLFKSLTKENTHFLSWDKKGLNGSAVYSGFSVETSPLMVKEPTIVVYVTHNESLAKKVRTFYKDCSPSFYVPVVEIEGVGIMEDFKKNKIRITSAPDVPEKIYNYFKEEIKEEKETMAIV